MKRILCFLLCCLISALIMGCSGGSKSSNDVAYMTVKAQEMMDDYIRDTTMAQSKYLGKNVQITGKLVRKGQFNNSSEFYAIIASTFELGRDYNILVEYPLDKADELNKLNFGDFVVAKGECVGIVPQKNPREISVQIRYGKIADGKNVAPTPAPTPTPTAVAPASTPAPVLTPVSYPSVTMRDIVSATHSSADVDGSYTHGANLTIDGKPETCWSEGVQGAGIGEYVLYNFSGTYKVSGINIMIGHQKSREIFYMNSRPVAITVVGSDGSREKFNLEDKMGSQYKSFSKPMNTSYIKIIVDRVASGSKWQDTSIAEVSFF